MIKLILLLLFTMPVAAYEVWGVTYTVLKTAEGYSEEGLASWYGEPFHGRIGANGEEYDMYAPTCAHRTLPLGTEVLVTYNGKSLLLTVTDRGPYIEGRIIDLSYAAAEILGLVEQGTVWVKVEAFNG